MTNFSMIRISLLASALTVANVGFAQPASSVKIEYVQSGIRVQISEAVSLRVVLDELCQQSNMRCEGTQHAEAFKVVPLSLSGRWQDVVARLTEGTGLNYVLRSPLARSNGELIVHPRSNATAAMAGRPVMPAQPSSVNSPVYIPPPITLPAETSAEEPREELQTGFTPASSVRGGAPMPAAITSPGAAQTSTGVALSPLTSEVATGGSEASVLPFPDSSGRPIPTSGNPTDVLPFPDSRGNPIPVKSGENVSPFPTGGAK